MQTNFTLAQLNDPETARSEHILRKCVHCGFCTATCPTYVLLGDERDSPRGRIYFIKAMLEGDRAPTASEVRHVDRCLSCLSLHDDLPVGRALHAPGRSRPASHRGALQAAAAGPAAARPARLADAATGGVPLGHGAGPVRQAAGGAAAGAQRRSRRCHVPASPEGDARSGAGPAGRPVAGRPAADLRRRRACGASAWR